MNSFNEERGDNDKARDKKGTETRSRLFRIAHLCKERTGDRLW